MEPRLPLCYAQWDDVFSMPRGCVRRALNVNTFFGGILEIFSGLSPGTRLVLRLSELGREKWREFMESELEGGKGN